VLKPRGSPDMSNAEAFVVTDAGAASTVPILARNVDSTGVLERGKGTGRVAWEPLMSRVKHKARGYPVPTRTGMKLGTGWIVQRRGRDLKTSVNKL
jgi:hypothetical protein